MVAELDGLDVLVPNFVKSRASNRLVFIKGRGVESAHASMGLSVELEFPFLRRRV